MIIVLRFISKIKSRAFTLVELLVVISIIALLMAILMPVLSKARRQSRAVKCLANLHQWGLIWQLYTQDNNSCFPSGSISHSSTRGTWIIALRPLYDTKEEIIRCPMATKRRENEECGGKFTTYIMDGFGLSEPEECSYGINCWVYNPPAGIPTIQNRPTEWNWRTNNVRGSDKIPLFGDSMWRGGGPMEDGLQGDPPQEEDGWYGYNAEMRHFCINRHDGGSNFLFMDSSARKVGLKELWKLKWHRNFNTNGPWTNQGGVQQLAWPKWMSKFSSY